MRYKEISKIFDNENFKVVVSEPFNDICIDFIQDLSNVIRKKRNSYKYQDLMYLSLWCSRKKILNLKKNFSSNQIRMGRGLIFHITPTNVPTNFFYSFIFSLLSGNSNIVKLPPRDFEEKKIILDSIYALFKKKKYQSIKNSNIFIDYNSSNSEITKKISSVCDGRIIWGGDDTINEVKKYWIPERSVELTFSDRYSLSIINTNYLKKNSRKDFEKLTKNFFYDGYSMNQGACNSPHFVFWIGKKNTTLENLFWDKIAQIVRKKFIFNHMIAVKKYSNLILNILENKKFRKKKEYKNYLYIFEADNNYKKIDKIRGFGGTFFHKNLKNISELKDYLSKKCQTISYYGFEKKILEDFLKNNNLFGVDRVVPIGQAMDINIVWDGYDVVKSLSRAIELK